jgi:uncharacterized membrane protein
MSRYELYLFIHIAAAVVWVGGGFMLVILGIQAEKANDERGLRTVFEQIGSVATKVIVPASVVVLLMGILMIVDGPWSLKYLWLVLGLLGYLATFATGIGILTPQSEKMGARLAAEGMTPANAQGIRRILTIARADVVVLFVVIADMALKPTGDDVGVLAVMAVAVVGGLAYVVSRLRAIGSEVAPTVAAPAA